MQGDTCTDEPVIRNAKKKQLLVSSNQKVRNLQLFTEYKLFQQTHDLDTNNSTNTQVKERGDNPCTIYTEI